MRAMQRFEERALEGTDVADEGSTQVRGGTGHVPISGVP